MHNIQLRYVLDARQNLLEKPACLSLFDVSVFDDEVEEFAPRGKLHYQHQARRSLNDLVELGDLWVLHQLQNVDFSAHSFDVRIVHHL